MKRVPSRRWHVLCALTLVNTMNFWQRNLLYSLASVWPPACLDECENAKFVPLCSSCDVDGFVPELESCVRCQRCRASVGSEFYSLRDAACISDAQYGLLASVSFTVMFACSGLVAGHLTDRHDPRNLHAAAVLVWSLSSFVKVVVPSYPLLVLMRVVMGVAQGFNAPCSYPVIAHRFEQHERATASGLYSMGTYLGSALSTLSLVIAMRVGWRMTTTLAVVCGIFSAATLYLVSEPSVRARSDDAEGVLLGLWSAFRVVRRNRRLTVLYLATSVRMTATVTLWTYLPTYYARAYPHEEVAFSIIYASGTVICGAVSSSVGGAAADRWASTNAGAHAFLPALGSFLAIAPMALMLYVDSFAASVACLLAVILVGECWLGPCMGLLIKDVPQHMTGTQVACLLVCNQLLASLGPCFISRTDDGTAHIRRPFFQVLGLCCSLSSAAFLALGVMHRAKATLPKEQDLRPSPRREHDKALLGEGPGRAETRSLLSGLQVT